MSRIGIYPGTFDPITKGHLDIIRRAMQLVDVLIVAVADDIPKTPMFSLEDRATLVRGDVATLDAGGQQVKVLPFKGLLVDFATEQKASFIIRGLRAVSDFEYEFQLAAANYRLAPEIPTIFLPASGDTHFVASRLVKEIARLGGDVSGFVSATVESALKQQYSK